MNSNVHSLPKAGINEVLVVLNTLLSKVPLLTLCLTKFALSLFQETIVLDRSCVPFYDARFFHVAAEPS